MARRNTTGLLGAIAIVDWAIIAFGTAPLLVYAAFLLVSAKYPWTPRLYRAVFWSTTGPAVAAIIILYVRMNIVRSPAIFAFLLAWVALALAVVVPASLLFRYRTRDARAAFEASVARGEAVQPVVKILPGLYLGDAKNLKR